MLWSEIRKWAKDHGYETLKEKEGETTTYYWAKLDIPDASGVTTSVSRLAFAIYNHMTDNKWLEHQTKFKNNQTDVQTGLTNYGN
jgi:hypothetical protein